MKDLLEAWNGLKDKEEVMNAIKRLVDPMMVGAFLTVPPGIWEFTFISSTGEALTIKDTEPVIIQPTRYASSGGEKEIDLGAVNVEIEKVIEKIDGEVMRLCPGQKTSRIFILLHNKGEQEFLATVTTDKMSVATINIDPVTGRIKQSKKTDIFSALSK